MVISVFRVPRVIQEDPPANSAKNRLIDFLEASWHWNRADYSTLNRKKKKERKRTSLVLYVSIPPPISRAPSIKPDRSGSVPREANSIRVSCDRGDAKLEAGLSIQPRVSLRESKKWFEALHRYSSFPDFRAIFQFESIAPASDLKDISHILIMSKLPSLFQFSRVYLLSMIWTLFSKRSNKYRSILF